MLRRIWRRRRRGEGQRRARGGGPVGQAGSEAVAEAAEAGRRGWGRWRWRRPGEAGGVARTAAAPLLRRQGARRGGEGCQEHVHQVGFDLIVGRQNRLVLKWA
uniref:Uncharacterized protein n=1 Tax=Oryza rufipogon TaxID=4529 RepID=A0A0E0QGH9_ORYRU